MFPPLLAGEGWPKARVRSLHMNASPIYDRINKSLVGKKDAHLFRTTAQPNEQCLIDLSTNSYLALHTNEDVAKSARELTGNQWSGNCASRIIAAQSPLFTELETEIAAWKKTQAALVFNSGYAANVGIIQALASRHTDVFCDKLNHASIIDGILLSSARMIRYRHIDMKDLAAKLAASTQKEKLIVTDSVFSMDGDCAPLADICDLARAYHCMVMVDEAHAMGILGKSGSGLVEELNLEQYVDVRMGTLSKSVAGAGGYVAGSSLLRDFFINYSRSFIYSTALPHTVLAWNLAAVRYIRRYIGLGKRLLESAKLFRDALHDQGFNTLQSSTQIVPFVLGNEAMALSLSAFLRKNGIKVPAIRPPTVPVGTARLRFSIHSGLSDGQLRDIASKLIDWKNGHGA